MAEADVNGAKAVLRKFVDAGMARDEAVMRACMTAKSLQGGSFNPESGPPPGSEIEFGEPAVENDSTVVIPMLGKEPGGAEFQPMMQVVMVKEVDGWKVDLATTMQRMMGGMMDNLTETLGGVMEGVGDALSEALDAFGEREADQTQDWSEAQLDPKRDELLPMKKMVKLPKLSAALSEAVGSPVVAEAAMDDLLMGDQSQLQVLMDWFEGPLFARWPEYLKAISEKNPLKGRLRGLRLEWADWMDQKCLVIDGSDLLYRMRLPEQDGFYQDDTVEWGLAGVLAGLPAKIDKKLAGKRLVLSDEEYGNLDVYKERVAPAYMRRISELVGKQVQLDVQWDDIYDGDRAVRQLQRWGMNRVYGAIALACQEPDLKARLSEELTRIRMEKRIQADEKYGKFEDGVLDLALFDYGGDAVGYWEQEIYNVLLGDTIVPAVAPMLAEEEASPSDTDAGAELSPEEQLNRENYESAVASFKETEPTWHQQLSMLLGGRAVGFTIDWDSMNGRFENTRGFVHRVISGALGGIGLVAFEPEMKAGLDQVSEVKVTGLDEDYDSMQISLEGDRLVIAVSMRAEGDPSSAIADSLRSMLGGSEVTETSGASHHSYGVPELTESEKVEERYFQARRYSDELEEVMKRNGLWPFGAAPEPLEVKGAFGCENMAFEQWLAWVLIPRVREIVETRGEFPENSALATYSRRAMDGVPGGEEVTDVLWKLDQAVEGRG